MIKTKILLKALSVMFLPTISILTIMLFLFLDWNNFITFVTSSDPWSIFFRFGITAVELFLIYYMYGYYTKEELKKEILVDNVLGTPEHIIENYDIRNSYIERAFGRISGIDGDKIKEIKIYKKDKKNELYIIEIINK